MWTSTGCRRSQAIPQERIAIAFMSALTYHPVFVRSPLPRDFRGFLPLPLTPLVADNIEYEEVHSHGDVQRPRPTIDESCL